MHLTPFIILGLLTVSCNQTANFTKKTVHKKTAATRLHEKYHLIRTQLHFPKAAITVPVEVYVLGAVGSDSALLPYVHNKQTDLHHVPDDQLVVPNATQCSFLLQGTKFFFNSGSTLIIKEDPPAASRFELNGEVNIETGSYDGCSLASSDWQIQVAHNSTLNIMAYDNEPDLTIVLGKGSAMVYRGSDTSLLSLSDDGVIIHKANDSLAKTRLNYEAIAHWKTGRLIYMNPSLAFICRQLERRYDVPVIDRTGYILRGFYSVPYRDQSLDEMIGLLQSALRLSREVRSDSIFLTAKQ